MSIGQTWYAGALVLLVMLAVEPRAESLDIEEVLVIGSRSVQHSALDSPAPVDVFRATELRRAGALGGNSVRRCRYWRRRSIFLGSPTRARRTTSVQLSCAA